MGTGDKMLGGGVTCDGLETESSVKLKASAVWASLARVLLFYSQPF